ncbi:hypothetical protein BBJ28_00012684 [Nothophytophthora sp. Chile5]|nr:hypothetical protein BBJ28_00012684 [Nothophytophthora sp. Chile5]
MPPPLAIVTCQHVACPWLFPRYFANKWDWLQFVSEEFVQHSLQLLSFEGPIAQAGSAVTKPEVLLDLPLVPQVHIHSERDLALLTLDGAAGQKIWEQAVSEFGLQSLALQSGSCSQGEPLLFSGHRQLPGDEGDEGEGFQVPKAVAGHFVGRSARGQEFAWSREVLEEGMCGGAVFGSTGECVGIVEGIVPPLDEATDASPPPEEDREAFASWQMKQALANHVAFIPSSEVRAFIAQPDDLLLTGMDLPPNIE